MTAIKKIRASICAAWTVPKCGSGQMSVRFSSKFDERLFIKLDLVRPRLRCGICDYLLFGHNSSDNLLWVIPVEFKTGKLVSRKVSAQLSGGARYAESLLGNHRGVRCFPVVVFGGKGSDAGRLKKERIRFLQAEWRIAYTKKSPTLPEDALTLMK